MRFTLARRPTAGRPVDRSAVRAERRPARMVFLASHAGTFRILSGHAQCAAPRYDLAALAARLTGAVATEIQPAACWTMEYTVERPRPVPAPGGLVV